MDEIKRIILMCRIVMTMLMMNLLLQTDSFRVPCGSCFCEDDLRTVYCQGKDLSHLGGIPQEVRMKAEFVDATENMLNGLYLEDLSGYEMHSVRIDVSNQRRRSCVHLMTEKPQNIQLEGMCQKKKTTMLTSLLTLTNAHHRAVSTASIGSTVQMLPTRANPFPIPFPVPIPPQDHDDNDNDDGGGGGGGGGGGDEREDSDEEQEEEEEEEEEEEGEDQDDEEQEQEGEETTEVMTTERDQNEVDNGDSRGGGFQKALQELKVKFGTSLAVMGVVVTVGFVLSLKIRGQAVRRAVSRRVVELNRWSEGVSQKARVGSKRTGLKTRQDLMDFRESGEMQSVKNKVNRKKRDLKNEAVSSSVGAARCMPASHSPLSSTKSVHSGSGIGTSKSSSTESDIFVETDLYKTPIPAYKHSVGKPSRKVKAK